MINANTVRELAESHLAGGTGFLVDVRVGDGNAISILLDDDEGTSIEKFIAQKLTDYLDRMEQRRKRATEANNVLKASGLKNVAILGVHPSV